MKVIFLDVDGVLSSFGERGLCSLRLDMFAEVVKQTGAEVVLSSTWRHPHCREQRMRLQRELGNRGVEFHSFTPMAAELPMRGDEIQTWLNGHRREQVDFVILDDDPNDEMGNLKPHLVKCDGFTGLNQEICNEIVKKLS